VPPRNDNLAHSLHSEQIRQGGLTLPLVHTANSAAIVRFPEAHFSLVRPGIMPLRVPHIAGHNPRI